MDDEISPAHPAVQAAAGHIADLIADCQIRCTVLERKVAVAVGVAGVALLLAVIAVIAAVS